MPGDFTTWLIYAALVLGAVAMIAAWRVLGAGPRRGRGLRHARSLLKEGKWKEALSLARRVRQIGTPSASWRDRIDRAEASCLDAARTAALADKQYEEALEHALKAGALREQAEIEARALVQSAMLTEVRRLFSTGSETRTILDLVSRALIIQSPCREASFWQGLCHLRLGEIEQAMAALQTARTGEARSLSLDELELVQAGPAQAAAPRTAVIDPPLYLGAVLLLSGKPKEALKYLTEANRIDAACPFVSVLLGSAIISAGGDNTVAVRALQRALGPKGLAQWEGNPQKAWVEAFPEGRSYIRKLAEKHPFICPLWGGDLGFIQRQGNLALAQGLFKVASYQEAAELFGKALREGAPSLTVLRGLGLSLARLGKYDEAFKHLATAHEMENPKERVTAGFLALCGARGTPTHEDDLPRNVAWAITTVSGFTAPGDKEWVALISAIFAQAREHNVTLSQDDQVYLCEHLWSVRAADPPAAQAFHHLQATFPKAVTHEYAWLYCRAAQQHNVSGAHALELFAQTFADVAAVQAFYTAQGWDFEAVEFNYLQRAAAMAPGQFPAALGPEYPARGADLLLARSLREEKAGLSDAALATATILAQLAPSSGQALDRLAYLYHRRGNDEEALNYLATWRQHHPREATPVVRQAVLAAQRGQLAESQKSIRQALELTQDLRRAKLGFLGARMTLHALAGRWTELAPADLQQALDGAEDFLQEALRADDRHPETLWLLAAVRWLRGDHEALARQAPLMDQPDVPDPRYHLFAAVCRLAAQDFAGVLEACPRIVQWGQVRGPALFESAGNGDAAKLNPTLLWPIESAFLAGLAQIGLHQDDAAWEALLMPAQHAESPSAPFAQALLGWIAFRRQQFEQAGEWWQKLDPKLRTNWKLTEALGGAVFLTALGSFGRHRFEEAAEKLRQAGRLGCRDRRLGSLLLLSLFKAGQQAVYGTSS